MTGGADEQFEIRAVTDEAPTASIEQPAANIFVTPQGEVPLVVSAKDDLALASVALHFNRSDRSDVEDFSVSLYQGPSKAEVREELGSLAAGRLGESRRIEHRWQLESLQLKPGAQITFWATASDYLPQVTKSTVRKLSIITSQELEERLAQRQGSIFGELERVLKLQQDARAQTKALEVQLNEVGRLEKQDVDRAQSAELNQRQVKRTLTSPGEGIQVQIADFLADLANNRVDSPDLERHMQAVSAELDRLGREHLSTIERELTSVIKAAQSQTESRREPAKSAAADDARLKESLVATATNQDQVVSSLEKLLAELSQWDNYRRFAREIAALGREQQELARATAEIGQQTLGREAKDLEPQQQADLKKLALKQADLSRRLEKVQQQMAAMTKAGNQTDPIATATVADGLHHAQRQVIAGRMRRAGEQVERNQLGQAAEQQAAIAKDLDDMLSILANRREQELDRLVKQLREAERELAALAKKRPDCASTSATHRPRLKTLRPPSESASSNASHANRRPCRRKLRGWPASSNVCKPNRPVAAWPAPPERWAARASRAAAAMPARQPSKPKNPRRTWKTHSSSSPSAASKPKKTWPANNWPGLKTRSKACTSGSSVSPKKRPGWKTCVPPLGVLVVRSSARLTIWPDSRKSLETETSLLAERLSLAEVINLALSGAAQKMARAVDMLVHHETGATTQEAQEGARLRFEQLLTAFKKDQKPGADQQGGGAGQGGGGGGPQGDAAQMLAQLKLLKILQEDLGSRYRTLTGRRDAASEQIAGQLAELAGEQGKLAELAGKLAAPPEGNPEDDPDKLPDVRGEPADDVPPEAIEGPDRKPIDKEPS